MFKKSRVALSLLPAILAASVHGAAPGAYLAAPLAVSRSASSSAADPKSLMCAKNIRMGIEGSSEVFKRQSKKSSFHDFDASQKHMFEELNKIDWERSNGKGALESIEEAGKIESKVAALALQINTLLGQSERLASEARWSGDANALKELGAALDSLKEAAAALNIYHGIAHALDDFGHCVIGQP